MSNFLDRLTFFKRASEPFSDGLGVTKSDDRSWENSYRQRWQYDKIVRSTHGVNCTGSCSWKVYVKNGLVTWETQQTDYPRTRPDLPNHEPRGCPRGASYSWYLYSANRVKYPLMRSALLKLWRAARKRLSPVDAWASIVEDKAKAVSYKSKRGMGGFVRVSWDETNELIAAANLYTTRQYGPDRVINHVRLCFLSYWISARLGGEWRGKGESQEVPRILRQWQTIRLGMLKLGSSIHRTVMTNIPKNLNDQLRRLGLASLFAAPPSR